MSEHDETSIFKNDEEKKAILKRLLTAVRARGDSAFKFINLITGENNESKNKLNAILNLFVVFYEVASDAFIDKDFFYILELYNNLFWEYITNLGNGAFEIDSSVQRALLSTLNDLHQGVITNLHINILSQFNNKVKSMEGEIADYRQQASEISNLIKKEVDKLKLSSFAGTFQKIADQESCAKIFWMGCALVFGIFATTFVFKSSIAIISNNFNITLVEFLQKLSNTIILYLIAYWCSRRYIVCRAQEIMYRHIAAVLSTYDMFKKAADSHEKGIIMSEMAHTIFSLPVIPTMKVAENLDLSKTLEILRIIENIKK